MQRLRHRCNLVFRHLTSCFTENGYCSYAPDRTRGCLEKSPRRRGNRWPTARWNGVRGRPNMGCQTCKPLVAEAAPRAIHLPSLDRHASNPYLDLYVESSNPFGRGGMVRRMPSATIVSIDREHFPSPVSDGILMSATSGHPSVDATLPADCVPIQKVASSPGLDSIVELREPSPTPKEEPAFLKNCSSEADLEIPSIIVWSPSTDAISSSEVLLPNVQDQNTRNASECDFEVVDQAMNVENGTETETDSTSSGELVVMCSSEPLAREDVLESAGNDNCELLEDKKVSFSEETAAICSFGSLSKEKELDYGPLKNPNQNNDCAPVPPKNDEIVDTNSPTTVISKHLEEIDMTDCDQPAPPDSAQAEEAVAQAVAAISPPSPTPPPRRLSQVVIRPPPRKMSSAHNSSASLVSSQASLFSPVAKSRLSFATLPRRALPPTKEEGRKKKSRSMFSWLGGDSSKKKNKEVLESVSEGLRKIYKQKLHPLEDFYKFHDFHSPALDDPDFDAKPMILLVGQYSTGKTTFIRYLLESDFPGIRIGPEPTTDRFIAVMHGEEEGIVPGNALVVDAKKQFRALSGFGNAFLNRFQCSTLNNQVLESVTIVDTPGILSGEKQRIDRGYDFTGVLEWFAERVDRIILLFDAHKLDISDEFKRCIEALSGNEDKIRIVLNKSDMVDHQQLMRVYGALMWSLGKVFKTPEVSRVYIGSFWDHPLHYDINRRLFQDEQHDLFQDLQALPRNAALRKLNDLIKRARLAKVHAFIIAELRKQMPSMIGKDKKKKELIQNLDKIFEQIQREHNISPGDFPDVNKMREKLQNQDFTKFNIIKPKLLEVVDGMLATDIARLMSQIPKEEAMSLGAASNGGVIAEQPTVKGGAFSQAQEAETPFGFGKGEGFDKGADENEWVVSRERKQADTTFDSLGPINGFVSGRAAKDHMVKSKLPNSVLGKIWKLADVDKDGQLDADEFALANYLINLKLEGHELPADLPKHLVPPSKRDQETVYPSLGDDE
ncbi:unnamed protein product [Caenorhabditis auriculariae]|uniref:Uncharacterized protein n=1 Tax=Caenorhabditis auriculariae TaxID=2777116 RepID=A0A8S1GVA5_9PELO|nr:unnamed protein product [Caenorhabditis auriculariae]